MKKIIFNLALLVTIATQLSANESHFVRADTNVQAMEASEKRLRFRRPCHSSSSENEAVLSFTNTFAAGGILPEGSELIPFVATPRGLVLGASVIADGLTSEFTFPAIFVVKPPFGVYHTGVQVRLSEDGFVAGLINLNSQVASNRGDSAPTQITYIGEEDTILPITPFVAGSQYQVLADFVFSAEIIP